MKLPTDITEISIIPIKPQNGLIGFCSFVIDEKFYIGNVGIHMKQDGMGIRLVYPKKNDMICVHPITKDMGDQITQAVIKKIKGLAAQQNLYLKNLFYNL